MSRHHILMGQNIALDTTCDDPTCCLAHGNLLLDDELRARDERLIAATYRQVVERRPSQLLAGPSHEDIDTIITDANEDGP